MPNGLLLYDGCCTGVLVSLKSGSLDVVEVVSFDESHKPPLLHDHATGIVSRRRSANTEEGRS